MSNPNHYPMETSDGRFTFELTGEGWYCEHTVEPCGCEKELYLNVLVVRNRPGEGSTYHRTRRITADEILASFS